MPDHDMYLVALYPTALETPAAFFAPLAIDDRLCRTDLTALLKAIPFPQSIMDLLPWAVFALVAKICVDRLPGRKIRRC